MKKLIAIVAMVLLAIPMVFAATTDVDVTEGANEGLTASDNAAATQATAVGGELGSLDVSAKVQTSQWQGYYGDVVETITLQDSAGIVLYDWSAGNSLTGTIYFTTSATLAGTLNDVDASDITDADTAFSVSGAETATATFTGSPATATLDSTATVVLKTDETTGSAAAITDDFVFQSDVTNGGLNYNGGATEDFNIIVPGGLSFYVYVELA
ncbi:MAG: hypothetical protein U9O94_00790 [Nanoarchaeota archaeon]|nr:hypothetical protein [Nanoarchaeota archaeon]